MEMLRGRRQLPLSTDAFDYTAYHDLDEVRKCKIQSILGGNHSKCGKGGGGGSQG